MQTRTILEKDIAQLNTQIKQMQELVDRAVEQAIMALTAVDAAAAQTVIQEDAAINALRHKVENDALISIARQQPMAGDLRAIMTAVYVAQELERMGDHAVNVARLMLRVNEEGEFSSLHKLPKMSRRVRRMAREAVQALLQGDLDLAQKVMADDERVDYRYGDLIRETLQEMRDDAYINRATTLLLIGQNLERIGDRATNIAERVQFLVTGVFKEGPSEPDF